MSEWDRESVQALFNIEEEVKVYSGVVAEGGQSNRNMTTAQRISTLNLTSIIFAAGTF